MQIYDSGLAGFFRFWPMNEHHSVRSGTTQRELALDFSISLAQCRLKDMAIHQLHCQKASHQPFSLNQASHRGTGLFHLDSQPARAEGEIRQTRLSNQVLEVLCKRMPRGLAPKPAIPSRPWKSHLRVVDHESRNSALGRSCNISRHNFRAL